MGVVSKEAQQPLSPFGNAVAGAIGGLIALAITYPLDIVKTRLQVQSKSKTIDLPNETVPYYDSTLDAIYKISTKEGILGLYAGLPAGLIGAASTNFAYFYWYYFLRSSYQKRTKASNLSTAAELLLGALAGALAQIFTIPVSVITTRQQTVSSSERKDLVGTAKEIISEDGPTGLWKGLKPSLILCVNPAITYGAFERGKTLIGERAGAELSPAISFWLGAFSKTLATIITYPYIMAKVRLQWRPPKPVNIDRAKEMVEIEVHQPQLNGNQISKKSNYDDISGGSGRKDNNVQVRRYSGAIDVLYKVLKNDGFFGWYTGMQAQITKAVLSQAILFYAKEYTTRYTFLLFALFTRLSLIPIRSSKKT
ncbi:hypothetical protein G9A89_009621 [Geosiphon pyriformis]|nr:hypothetical protein G9A89_009621 [Geosiphon pyriformis]